MQNQIDYGWLDSQCDKIFERHDNYLDEKRKSDRRSRKAAEADSSPKPPSRRRKTRREFKYRLPQYSDHYISELNNEIGFLCAHDWPFGTQYLHIERGLLHLYFAFGQYKELQDAVCKMSMLDIHKFQKGWVLEIEDLWDESSYRIHSFGKRLEDLTPVNRYRIRRRVRCPTKDYVGERKYKIDAASKALLNQMYLTEKRPGKEEKMELVHLSGLSYETVSNWFKNKRQRDKKGSSQITNGSSTQASSTATNTLSVTTSQVSVSQQEPVEHKYMLPDQIIKQESQQHHQYAHNENYYDGSVWWGNSECWEPPAYGNNYYYDNNALHTVHEEESSYMRYHEAPLMV